MRKMCRHTYHTIISTENLLLAWQEFVKGKRQRKDVQVFEQKLMKNILSLHNNLVSRTYRHSQYQSFNISDPKPRNIHKAEVRDRLLHHALYRVLYPFFDATFASHSFSCRKGKGMHKALDAFTDYGRKVSYNHTKTAWVLKCDIRKFFASIDHGILKNILGKYIEDQDIMWLLSEIIGSFWTGNTNKGLPLGNLTSQLFVNIYMNEFDQFMKHKLKARYYIRYADDFAILSHNKNWLTYLLPQIQKFLLQELTLTVHPKKISISTIASGVDFLGWVHFSDHRVLRTTTKRRVFRGIREKQAQTETVQSYLGVLSHGQTQILQKQVQGFAEEIVKSRLG